VTDTPNRQTKRVTPLKYRFDVAMTGRLGFELHPKNLKPEEVAFAKAAVADYKRIRPVVQRGDLYRLVSPYEKPLSAVMYASETKDAAAVFALGLKIKGERVETLRLRGLDPAARYSVKEINRGKALHAALPEAATGRELMDAGVEVRLSGDYDSAVFEVVRL
jgi:alpha-galactosidase